MGYSSFNIFNIIFSIIFGVASLLSMATIGDDLLDSGPNQISGLSAQLKQQLTNEYDGVKISGFKVLSAVNQYYNSDDLVMVLYNTEDAYETSDAGWVTQDMIALDKFDNDEDRIQVLGVGSKKDSNRVSLNKYSNSSNEVLYRVVTSGTYMAKIIENKGLVVGVAFVRID